jgi:hypothetical protein
MFTHSSRTTPVPPASPRSSRTTPVPPASPRSFRATQVPAASPAAPTQKRKRNVLEQIPTPPPRRRAKTQRFASEEAQKAGAADVRARKKASAASKKTVKNIHSQHMRQLQDAEVYTVTILLLFRLALC